MDYYDSAKIDDFALQVEEKVNNLAKPPGSLGTLEKQLKQVYRCWGTFHHTLKPKHIVFAADNGVVHAGVVAQLSDITYMQSSHMVEGTSAVTCFCRAQGIPWEVVDVGIDSDEAVGVGYKIRRGTRNFAVEPAMTEEELRLAMAAGRERVEGAVKDGYNILTFGEMGIGNTTTSAAVLSALAPEHSSFLTGYGSARGNFKLLLHKRRVVADALKRYGSQIHDAADALRYVGGYDLAALCGAMMTCADQGLPFYIDGFITAVALACAISLKPAVRSYALPSHMSAEPGMAAALRLCQIDEYDVPIYGQLSLGEGTGAVLAVTLLSSMFYAANHMATLIDINNAAERRHEKRKSNG